MRSTRHGRREAEKKERKTRFGGGEIGELTKHSGQHPRRPGGQPVKPDHFRYKWSGPDMPVARPVPRGVCVPRGIIFVTSGAAREREREEQRISSCTFACVHLSWGGAACARVQLSYPKNAHAAPASSGERVAKTRRSVCVFTERTFTSPGPWPLSHFRTTMHVHRPTMT